jgi:hypothetical protein
LDFLAAVMLVGAVALAPYCMLRFFLHAFVLKLKMSTCLECLPQVVAAAAGGAPEGAF